MKTTANDPMKSYIGAAGIGVSDLDRAEAFYTEVFGLSLRYEYPVEGYVTERIIELIEDQALAAPYLTALGLGVSDLDEAKAFYTDVLAGLVVMHYTDGREHDYEELPVKSVHFVGDSRAMTAKVKAEGLPVVAEPQVLDLQGTKALIGLTSDHDGYAVEFLTR